jgi:O-antigen biosynthesis protein WbqL
MDAASAEPVLEVRFDRNGNAADYTVAGWSEPETRFAWTVGPASLLRLPKPPGSSGFHCWVYLLPFTHPPYLMRQRVIISVDTVTLYDECLTQAGEVNFQIPAVTIAESDTIDLLFQCPECVPPVVIGAGGDPRFLGVACHYLRLKPVPERVQAVACATLAASSAGIGYGGVAKPDYVDATDIGTFGTAHDHERMLVFGALTPPPQIPLHREENFDPELVSEHYRYPPPGDIYVYALKDFRLWGNGVLTHGGEFFLQNDCVPRYFEGYVKADLHSFPEYWAGALDRNSARTIDVGSTCAVALHPNAVYGHFLLEVLPKLYLLGVLRDLGMTIPVAISDQTPQWVLDFVGLYFAGHEIVRYDMTTQNVRAASFIVPSMMHTDHNFHPALNLVIADVFRRAGIAAPPRAPGAGSRRIYLSRRLHRPGWHRLENEEEVEAVMVEYGFEIVHPQTLPLRRQLALYASADVIAGQYGSALHNAMFGAPGAVVIGLNWINWYQSMIGRVRRQKLAFVRPADGVFRTWRTRGTGDSGFRIDPGELRHIVSGVLENATRSGGGADAAVS